MIKSDKKSGNPSYRFLPAAILANATPQIVVTAVARKAGTITAAGFAEPY